MRKIDTFKQFNEENRTTPIINLDINVLRTLVAAQVLGGFNRAAEKIGRSQSSVSLQMRKFEERVGQPLFRKQGRGLALTDAGGLILTYARRILDLNDEATMVVSRSEIEGSVRFGLPGDFAESWLPAALGRFERAHSSVHIEASVDRNAVLLDRLDKGQLDLVLIFGGNGRSDAEIVATLPIAWIGGRDPVWTKGKPVPLALLAPPCVFRQAGLAALGAAGISWRITSTSASLAGLWAAVDAGLGITLRTPMAKPDHLTVVDEHAGLPPLPAIELSIHSGGRPLMPATARLREILFDMLTAKYLDERIETIKNHLP